MTDGSLPISVCGKTTPIRMSGLLVRQSKVTLRICACHPERSEGSVSLSGCSPQLILRSAQDDKGTLARWSFGCRSYLQNQLYLALALLYLVRGDRLFGGAGLDLARSHVELRAVPGALH